MPNPNRRFWQNQRVIVTGGAGFLGSYVVDALRKRGAAEIFVPRSREVDLRKENAIQRLLQETQPTMIIHLAANCGGIGANQAAPGEFFYDNAIMGILLMEQARLAGVKKFVQIGTVCAYPKFTPSPFKEKDIWTGYPEETNAPYGLAKKMLLVQAQAYRRQYNFNAIYLLPANLYGPRDHFDLQKSHVIPALIRKFLEANEQGNGVIQAWGTGKPTREFLYVEDAAEAILLAAEHYDKPEPLNIGSGKSISIQQLISLLARLTQFKGRVKWDRVKWKDGQPKRMLNTQRAQKEFGFKAKTSIEVGLRKTIDWYQNHRQGGTETTAPAPKQTAPQQPESYKHPVTGKVVALVIRNGFQGKKYNFFTPHDYPLQLGLNFYAASETIQPHVHVHRELAIKEQQECLIIRKGHLIMHLFDQDQKPLFQIPLYEGDVALQVSGGHGFEIKQPTEILEVKQGPFTGDTDKVRFQFKEPSQCL